MRLFFKPIVFSAFAVWFALSAASAPAAGVKADEFAKVNKEWHALVGNLAALKVQYHNLTDAAQKADVAKKYHEELEKGNAMLSQLIESAKNAYVESPNGDPEITKMLVDVLADWVARDDYEKSFELGKIMVENKCPDKSVAGLAGVSAFCVNEFDLAETWLNAAKASGSLSQEHEHFLDTLPYYKEAWAKEKQIRAAEAKADDLPRVAMKTNEGTIEIELFENEAPNTVLNFITLVEKGFYDGLTFHRVLPAFMAQGGDPKGTGSGGPDYTIPCECPRPDHRLHFRGTLSMAHAGRDTGGSQFFLTFLPTQHLDGKHTAFGRVVSGFDVLAKLKRRNPDEPTAGAADKIIEAKVTRKRPHPYDVKELKKS